MSELRRILVCVDLDAGSQRALTHALRFVGDDDAAVDVLHVWEPPKLVRPDPLVTVESDGRSVFLTEFTQNQARADLEKLVSDVAPNRPNLRTLLALGSAASQILAIAREGDYDLIVLGTRGVRGVARAVLGSVAEKVVRLASCPVLIVPLGSDDHSRAA